MQIYAIETRFRAADGDPAAPALVRLARQIGAHLNITAPQIERRDLYLLGVETDGDPVAALNTLAGRIFGDPILQDVTIGELRGLDFVAGATSVVTAYQPGVTDAVGASALDGITVAAGAELADAGLEIVGVRTAARYVITPSPETPHLDRIQLDTFLRRSLINTLVEGLVILDHGAEIGTLDTFAAAQFDYLHAENSFVAAAPDIALRNLDDAALLRLSQHNLLALDLDEMRAIQDYYRELGRDPSDVELETLAQTWSEHCVHKTFKAEIAYTETSADPHQPPQFEMINGLFQTYIVEPTRQLGRKWVRSAFKDNAGIIAFDDHYDLAIKAETHNHPSALEPFGGANTGIGGVIRDVMAMSAQPIANYDVLCFGYPDTPDAELGEGVLPPQTVFEGVVAGIQDYGNKMGIPTVGGAVLFDKGYVANPLVYCGTLGIAPRGSHPDAVQAGDLIVVVGGRTGRDGIHGATFSSLGLGAGGESSSTASPELASVVQIGNPITEKRVLDFLLQARDERLYSGLTDCGAGGLSSAVGEMGEKIGAQVDLATVPLKYAGLKPWEVWLSEAQERMVLAVPPAKLERLHELAAQEGAEATVIGTFGHSDGHGATLTVTHGTNVVAQMAMRFLHNGRPRRSLKATWQPVRPADSKRRDNWPYADERPYTGFAEMLTRILSEPNVASKGDIIHRYDHEVQGATIIKPLVGPDGAGPSDAAVLRPLHTSRRGAVLGLGINPRYSRRDPYWMAAAAIDEAIRNVVAVGADPARIALLDNFCWGSPADPAQLGGLVRAARACRDFAIAYGTPFVSGKDSLNNGYTDPRTGTRVAIPGTLLITALGLLDDIARAVTLDLKAEGNRIYIIGATRPEMGGTIYAALRGITAETEAGYVAGDLPHVRPDAARRSFVALHRAITRGLVRSCHDLSEGGLAVAAAEMVVAAMHGADGLGLRLDLLKVPFLGLGAIRHNDILLFSESQSRFLVEVAPQDAAAFEAIVQQADVAHAHIGSVTGQPDLNISGIHAATILRLTGNDLRAAWQTPLIPE